MYDSKDWWTSRTIWSAAAAVIASLALLAGIEMDLTDVAAMTDALLSLGSIIGGLMAIYFRGKADRRIK